MTVHPFDIPGAVEDGSESPGRRLREARTAARLSQDDVAVRLRLDRRVVDALERDDHRSLPEPTFVRGYLRSYARLLGLPAGPIVEAYDREGHTPPGLVADLSRRQEVRSSDPPVRLMTYVVVAALVTLGVLWWRYERTPEPVPLDQAGATPPPVLAAPALTGRAAAPPPTPAASPAVAGTPTPAAAGVPALAAGPALAPGTTAAPGTPTPALPVRAGATAAATAPTPPAGMGTAAPAAPPGSVAPGATAASAAAEPASTPPAVPEGGPNRLVLRFKHDSWVEVYERGGKRVFFNQAKGGQVLSLSGTPPFRVILGYARDAQVEYNGALFDHAPHTSRDIARFTVGG